MPKDKNQLQQYKYAAEQLHYSGSRNNIFKFTLIGRWIIRDIKQFRKLWHWDHGRNCKIIK